MTTTELEQRADSLRKAMKARGAELERRAKTVVATVSSARDAGPLILSSIALATAGAALYVATRKEPSLNERMGAAVRSFQRPRSGWKRHGGRLLMAVLLAGLGEAARRALAQPKSLPRAAAAPAMSMRDPFPSVG